MATIKNMLVRKEKLSNVLFFNAGEKAQVCNHKDLSSDP